MMSRLSKLESSARKSMTRESTYQKSDVSSLTSLFQSRFGTASRVFRAPARVNLIGDHTDYNDGFVMPAAIGFFTWVAVAKRKDRLLQAYSVQFDEESLISLDDLVGPPRNHWGDFIRGVAAMLLENGHTVSGANLIIDGDIPLGAGLSSSASLEVALALALADVSGLSLPQIEIVKLCQRAEHDFVGTRCGIMDQFAVSFGADSRALMLDCRSLDFELLPVPAEVSIVVCNSMVRHEHASGKYNSRRADCEAGVEILRSVQPEITALRDLQLKDLKKSKHLLSERVYRRCRHVVSENRRVLQGATAFKSGDAASFGRLMYESHASLRDDYEVSCKELDLLVKIASSLPGVYGARMTGGGFGGCTVNLVSVNSAREFQATMAREYSEATSIIPAVYVCEAVQGAGASPNTTVLG